MKAKAKAQVRQIILSGIFCTGNFAFCATGSESAGDNNTVNIIKMLGYVFICNGRCFNPLYFDVTSLCYARMLKGIDYRGIAVTNSCVFTCDANGYFVISGADFVGEIAPLGPGLTFVPQIDSVLYF